MFCEGGDHALTQVCADLVEVDARGNCFGGVGPLCFDGGAEKSVGGFGQCREVVLDVTDEAGLRGLEDGKVIEAAGDAILGKRLDVDLRSEQVAEGVDVFDPVEPAQPAPAVAGSPFRLVGLEALGDPAGVAGDDTGAMGRARSTRTSAITSIKCTVTVTIRL